MNFRFLVAIALVACTITGHAKPEIKPGAFDIRGMKGLFWEGIDKYNQAVPWMAAHNMNWLMLCYSIYPESAADWRQDYTPQHVAEMKDLVTRANDKGVTICLSFNPGIWSKPPLNHSSEEDYQAAWRKVQMAHSIGIQWIALCLDDISKEMVPADKEKYGTLQVAQVAYANRLWQDMQKFDPAMRLIFCPSAYTTEDMEKYPDYTAYVGENLARGIDIFWTGPTVCSVTISVADAQHAEKHFKRKPFIWDNYPVNDMFGATWRPLLAPLKGRDAQLASATAGILFNPMKQWEINRIPMVSVANYLADPINYKASEQIDKTLQEFTPEERPAIQLLLKYYGSAFWGDKGFPPAPRATTRDEARAVHSDLIKLKDLLSTESSTLEPMWDDIKEIVEKDIKAAELLNQQGITPASEWKGGAPELAEKAWGEKSVGLVYAASTGKNRITGTLDKTDVPRPKRIILMAATATAKNPQSAFPSMITY